jgi:hypothetical protein
MKTIEVNLFKFNELSNEARRVAVDNLRERMYGNPDVAGLVIDDCYLFEPLNIDLVELFGEEYTKLDKPIIGNTRKVYFDTDRNSHLDADEGIEINNERMFLLWLGIPESMHKFLCYSIKNSTSRHPDTKIEFEPNEYEYEFSDEENEILESAADKFSDHMYNILNRISDSIEFFYSDDYLEQELEDGEDHFTEDGITH